MTRDLTKLSDAEFAEELAAANAHAAALYERRDELLAELHAINAHRTLLDTEEQRRIKAAADEANPDRGTMVIGV